jgi:hypothetical protein
MRVRRRRYLSISPKVANAGNGGVGAANEFVIRGPVKFFKKCTVLVKSSGKKRHHWQSEPCYNRVGPGMVIVYFEVYLNHGQASMPVNSWFIQALSIVNPLYWMQCPALDMKTLRD